MSLDNVSPTRINLIQTKRALNLAESGRDILERKRDILLRELRHSVYDAERARDELSAALEKAFQSLQEANLAKGSENVENVALGTSLKANFALDYRSIMGVAIPVIEFLKETGVKPDYGFASTNVSLDQAFKRFYDLLAVVAELAKAEAITFQIANDIRKTQRRVNALDFVLIPKYKETVKHIQLVLEEKDREEFVRTKKVKKINQERTSTWL